MQCVLRVVHGIYAVHRRPSAGRWSDLLLEARLDDSAVSAGESRAGKGEPAGELKCEG